MNPLDYGQIGQILKTFKSSSAAIPGLYYLALTTPLSLGASLVAPEPLNYFFAGLAALPVAIVGLQISFFSVFDRDRLQNEEHVEKKLIIAQGKTLIGDKNAVVDMVDQGQLVDNPALEDRRDA